MTVRTCTAQDGVGSGQHCHQPTFQELCQRIQNNEVSSVDLSDRLESWERLGQCMETSTKLTTLNLANNDLSVTYLRFPTSLVNLNLAGNRFHQVDFESVMPNLKSLDLSSNGISSFDVSRLCNLLQTKCPSLSILRLANNDIGARGMLQLCETLRHLKLLEHLDLRGNFGAHTSEAYNNLVSLAESNRSLTQLHCDVLPSTNLRFHLEMNRFARRCIQDYQLRSWAEVLSKPRSLEALFTILRRRPDIVVGSSGSLGTARDVTKLVLGDV